MHMEKQLGQTHKLAGAQSLGISKIGQTVLVMLMESEIWHKLPGSVERRFRKETVAYAHLDARYFSSSH